MSNSSWIINPEKLSIGEGTRVYYIRRPWTSMLTLRIIFSEDVYLETADNNGISYLSSRMLLEGSQRWSLQELNMYMEKYAIESMALCGGLQFTCLEDSWPNLKIVLEEILKRPKLDKERFSKVKRQIEQELKSSFDDSDQLANFHLRRLVFDKSPGNLLSSGSPKSIALIRDHQVCDYWARNLHAKGLRIFMVGPMDSSSIESGLDKVLPSLVNSADFVNELPSVEPRKQIQRKFVFKDRKKASIAMGHIGVKRWSENYSCLRLVDQVLGASSGFTSRLASRLREDLGLCYYIYGDICSSAGRIPGIFQIMMGTSPENVEEAIGQIKVTIEELLKEGPELMELEDARSYLLGSMAFSFETNSSLVQLMLEKHFYNLDEDFLIRDRRKLLEVTSKEFHQISLETLDVSKLHSVVVGANSPSDWM